MMNKRIAGILIAFLLILLSFTGCSESGNKTIARVGDHEIKTDEFNERFMRLRKTYLTTQDEYNGKRELLDSMIVTQLLIQAAYEKNIDKLDELARVVLANKDKFLLDALYQKNIAQKAVPTEGEIKNFYDHLEYKIRVSHILVENSDTAQMLYERINNGDSFEELASEYSIDQQAKQNKGDLGYFVWGAMVENFQEAAFNMEPGEISPPVKSRYGYHIIKLVDKLPNDKRASFDSMKESIKAQITGTKTRILTEKYFEKVKTTYPVNIETSTCEYLLHKREQLYPEQLLATLPKNDFDLEQLDRDEKELVLATWDGGQLTLNEYLNQIKNIPKNVLPDFDDYDSLSTIIFELKKLDILILEALREGYDNDEIYLGNLKMFKELNMADIMKNDSITKPPPPVEEDLRKYYDENPDEFTKPAQVHVYEILLSDEIKARKLVKEIKSLEAFKEKAKELTERPGKKSKSGDLGYIERKTYSTIFDLATKTAIGEIAGPVVSSRKYSIFYVVDKIEPQIRDFLNVKRVIDYKLKKQQKDSAFQEWVDERLKSTRIEIDEDAIWSSIDTSKYTPVDSTS